MKKYRIKVLMHGGSTSYLAIDHTIKGELVDYTEGFYKFMDENGKVSYYPILNTIIQEQ